MKIGYFIDRFIYFREPYSDSKNNNVETKNVVRKNVQKKNVSVKRAGKCMKCPQNFSLLPKNHLLSVGDSICGTRYNLLDIIAGDDDERVFCT